MSKKTNNLFHCLQNYLILFLRIDIELRKPSSLGSSFWNRLYGFR